MKREIWNSDDGDNKKDSLFLAAEIVKEYARASISKRLLADVLGDVYKKIEELRREIK